MKKLIFIFCLALLLVGNLKGQTVVSDDYYLHCSGSTHFNTPPGSIGVFNYGINGSNEVYVDLQLFQPSANSYSDYDITFMEAFFNIYDSEDNLIGSDYGYLNNSGYYITTGSYIYKSLSLPNGAVKIVFNYWMSSEDPYHDNPPLWDVVEDREIVVSIP